MNPQHFDVLIIGAGLAGVGTACRIAQAFPGKRMALLERRERIGGTWDLFRYPGIRSDTDMYNYGFPFRPWHSPQILGSGAEIGRYIADTAREFGVDKHIHFGLKIESADWSSDKQCWNLSVLHEASGETRKYSCDFLIGCTGYYNADAGYLPSFPGQEQFKGVRIHPQHWPENLDYAGKQVVVIGSGATAITLVPAMADAAAHVTMLQRSPTYIVSLPGHDTLSVVLDKFLPKSWVYRFARKRQIWLQRGFYLACRRWPDKLRKILLSKVQKEVGKDFDMRHFTPDYMPWDQRVCVVPDADLFEQIKGGKASVVTDHIDTFTADGIRLKSGDEIKADIIVAATGLNLQMLGGIALSVDGQAQKPNELLTYKGVFLEGIPNFAWVFGGGNAPWTLRVDLVARYLCRLFKHMDDTGQAVAVACDTQDSKTDDSVLSVLQSSYVLRGRDALPRQGRTYPWKIAHHLGRDTEMLLKHPIHDQWLQFSPRHRSEADHAA